MAVTHLTTAMASNRGTDFVNANGGVTGTNITGTIYSNGLFLSVANPGAGGGAAIKGSGTYSQNTGTVEFANSNGITFGLSNNGTMTASHNGLTAQSAYVFSNSNGISFGTNGSTVTATVATNYQSQGAYLTTAALSDHSHGNPTLALTNISGTTASNSAGLTLSLSANPAGGADGVNILAAGTQTANTTGSVLFNNGNGVTFGMSNNSVITASVATNYQSQGAYLTTARASNDAIGLNSALTANGVSVTANSSGLSLNFPAFLTTAAQSNHSHNLATTTTNGSLIVVATTNSNGATFAVPPFLTTAQAPGAYLTTARASNDAIGLNTALTANGVSVTANSSGLSLNFPAFLTTAALSNHSHGNPTLALTNLSGTTASNSAGLTLSLSAAAPGGGADVVASASNGAFTFTTLGFSNANNVTFGTSAGSIITASVAAPGAAAENNWVNLLGANTAGNTTASGSTIGYSGINLTLSGTNGSVVNISAPAVSSLVGTNGISLSTGGSTISVSPVFMSYHAVHPYDFATHTTSWAQSTSGVYPFVISQPLSMDRVRMLYSGSIAASSTQATTGNTSLSMSAVTTHNLVFYSRGAGANSLSLQYVTSTQVVDQQLVTVSMAANSTQFSYSNRITLGTASFTKDYSSSAASLNFHTSNLTDLTGARYIDIPAGLSLPAGQWWVAYGRSTASATQNASISVATRMLVSHNSQFGHSQNTLAIGMIGGNTNSSVGFRPAHGSFTTGGAAGTTGSITMANVSTAASNHMLHMQFMRIT